MNEEDPIKIMKEKDMVMCCIHVTEQKADAEYMKEDDSYVCTSCRDEMADKGFESVMKFLAIVHRSCLGI